MSKRYRQDAPFAVQLEAVEGCNLRCPFCGLNGIRGKKNDYKMMDTTTMERIATGIADAGWNPRIEFAMHGEPTVHKDLPGLVSIVREALPKVPILVTSNGSGLVKDPIGKAAALFEAGVTTLAVDEYQGVKWAEQIRTKLADRGPMDGIEYHEYPEHPAGNPHQRTPKKRFVIIAPIDLSKKGTHSMINNHAGAGAPKNENGVGKRCAKPFREMSFRWDGSVAICCNDWRGEFVVGRVQDMTVEAIWQHPRLMAARKKLVRGARDFGPCDGCDAVSYRVGLLPDKKGKATMGKINSRDVKLIKEALADGPLTKPALRPWEEEA